MQEPQDAVDLLLQLDKMRYQFPQPPRHLNRSASGPEPEVFSMDDVVQTAKSVTRSSRGDGESELISFRPSLKTEPDDKQHQGIPIPGAATKKNARRHSCGLQMDSDAVLDELAASEGGFNKNWQCHRGATS
jgi:hypothetical protein